MQNPITPSDARRIADFLDSHTMVHRWLVAFFRNFQRFPVEAAPYWSLWSLSGASAASFEDITGVVAHHFPTATTYVGFSGEGDPAQVDQLIERELLPERIVGDGGPMNEWAERSPDLFRRAARREDLVVLELPPGHLDPAAVPAAGFRLAGPADAGTLREFELLYASEMGLEDPESDIDSLVDEGMAYVHEEEGKITGTVRSNLSDGRYVHVGGVYVHPRFRRRGIGAKLVAGVSERIHREGSTVILDAARENEPALRTYRSLGFHDAGEGVSLRFPEDAFRSAE